MPVRKLVFALLGLLSILALSLLPGGNLEFLSDADRTRMGAGIAFVVLLILRAIVRPPKPPSKRAIAWGEFATTVSGTMTEERRGFGGLGWTGSTTVRWDSR